jgi:hypothetical protein
MSKSDSLKEEIGLLKLVLAALIAIDLSLIAWLAQHYASAGRMMVRAAVAATLVMAGVAAWVTRRTYQRIEELEDV